MLNVRKMPNGQRGPSRSSLSLPNGKVSKVLYFFKDLYHFPKVIEPMQQLERAILEYNLQKPKNATKCPCRSLVHLCYKRGVRANLQIIAFRYNPLQKTDLFQNIAKPSCAFKQ